MRFNCGSDSSDLTHSDALAVPISHPRYQITRPRGCAGTILVERTRERPTSAGNRARALETSCMHPSRPRSDRREPFKDRNRPPLRWPLRVHRVRIDGPSASLIRRLCHHEVTQFTLHRSWDELERYANPLPENLRDIVILTSAERIIRPDSAQTQMWASAEFGEANIPLACGRTWSSTPSPISRACVTASIGRRHSRTPAEGGTNAECGAALSNRLTML
jgi:hypothetical protein